MAPKQGGTAVTARLLGFVFAQHWTELTSTPRAAKLESKLECKPSCWQVLQMSCCLLTLPTSLLPYFAKQVSCLSVTFVSVPACVYAYVYKCVSMSACA